MIKNLAVVAVISVGAAACQTTPGERPAALQVGRADVEYGLKKSLDCQIAAARRIDDRRSDARTIGRAVVALCDREMAAARLIFAWHRDMSARATQHFVGMTGHDVDMATDIVRQVRAGKLR